MGIHEDVEMMVVSDLPSDHEMVLLTIPEPTPSVASEVVAKLESGKHVLKLTSQVGRAGEVMNARVFIDDPTEVKLTEQQFGVAAAALAQSIEKRP